MRKRTALLALGILTACQGPLALLGKGEALSYAQVQSLEKGMRAKTILRTFGEPLHRLEKEGRVVGLTYRCEDARGKIRELRLGFSPDGVLQRWTVAGSKP